MHRSTRIRCIDTPNLLPSRQLPGNHGVGGRLTEEDTPMDFASCRDLSPRVGEWKWPLVRCPHQRAVLGFGLASERNAFPEVRSSRESAFSRRCTGGR